MGRWFLIITMFTKASATLHSYKVRLWSNYGYGKKKTLSSPESVLLSGNDNKGENPNEQFQ